jgi:Antibiotic biosynthesis monooxygenase
MALFGHVAISDSSGESEPTRTSTGHFKIYEFVFPIERQLAIDGGPVVLVNVFTLDKVDEQTFLQAWQIDAAFMKQQPGFISAQLHRALGERCVVKTPSA